MEGGAEREFADDDRDVDLHDDDFDDDDDDDDEADPEDPFMAANAAIQKAESQAGSE